VLESGQDLSTRSQELQAAVRDWVSEYHFSNRRTLLLRPFMFHDVNRVLEVGAGCGAITRFLGETFAEVVAVEGSARRASLARLRTRDLPHVKVICAPYQALGVERSFDLVVCVGVLEYAGRYFSGSDPYEEALESLSNMLAPRGVLLLAIENQFGAKYFCNSREDHTDTMFEGLEGYPRSNGSVRTFGKVELETRLRRHFQAVAFFYPFPDYKLPRGVLSEEALELGGIADLVSGIRSRDYGGASGHVIDEPLLVAELARNQQLDFFSNSFLVLASKAPELKVQLPALGVMYSTGRRSPWETVTVVTRRPDGRIVARKNLQNGHAPASVGNLALKSGECDWVASDSLHLQVLRGAKRKGLSWADFVRPCLPWKDALLGASDSGNANGSVPGQFWDFTWQNAFVERGQCHFVDREWEWKEPISVRVIMVRAAYVFLETLSGLTDLSPTLAGKSRLRVILRMAHALGIPLAWSDFVRFAELEAEISALVMGGSVWRRRLGLYSGLVRQTLRRHRPVVPATGLLASATHRVRALFARRGA